GAAAVIKAGDSLDAHAYDTISGGDWLSDQDAVEAFVREAPEEMLRLEHWGCPWSREPDGHIAVRPFGGMKIERTWFAADKTGFHMLHTLFQTAPKEAGSSTRTATASFRTTTSESPSPSRCCAPWSSALAIGSRRRSSRSRRRGARSKARTATMFTWISATWGLG